MPRKKAAENSPTSPAKQSRRRTKAAPTIHTRIKVFLEPTFGEVDEGDGGIRRVVEAQRKHLPDHGITFVDRLEDADVIAAHAVPHEATIRYVIAHPEVPFVSHTHGLYWQEYEWGKWEHAANGAVMNALRLADAITAPSEWVAQSVRRNTLRKAEAIWHGVDLDEWPLRIEAPTEAPPLPPGIEADPVWGMPDEGRTDQPYVLWNKTRTDPVCNPMDLVKLVRLAPDVPFRTTFWPDGEPMPANVTVTGKLGYEEAKREVQGAGVYLCTTRETFGIGTIEAMACSMPILGWKWGGQAEFIKHQETGWLAQPGDFDGLAEGLRWCLQHRAEAGRAARADVEARFQWKDVIPAYDALYRRVLAEKRALWAA